MVTPNSLVLQHSYRHLGPEAHAAARAPLSIAADALNMAFLTLEGSQDDGRQAKHERAVSARGFLAEAAHALARARVYIPGIRTYAINVVTNAERDVDRELTRLHDLCAKLLWRNHAVLPARREAEPLAPEDEAQLALVVRELATHARIDRAMRHKWLVATAVFGSLTPALGVAMVFVASITAALALVELARSMRDGTQTTRALSQA